MCRPQRSRSTRQPQSAAACSWKPRFHITAKRDLKKPILKLDPGWNEGLSMNTVEPSPVDETSDDGRHSFTLGPIAETGGEISLIQRSG